MYNCRIEDVASLLLLQRHRNATATLPLRPSRHHCLHVIRSVKTF